MSAPNSSKTTIRSPSYPGMSLKDAVEKIGKIEKTYRSAPIDRENAAKLIGYSGLSGPASKALADLASFGFLERAGKGEARVTERARDILHAESQAKRLECLAQAALEPELFRELKGRFPGMPIPPEDGIVTYLNRQGFNPTAVRPATRAFLESMSYLEEIGANKSHGDQSSSGLASGLPQGESPEKAFGGAKVGDLIQWETSGSLQFEKPRRVRMVSEDGQWVAVEGSQTGIPMSQVIVESSSSPAPPMFPLEQDRQSSSAPPASVSAGEKEWLRGPLSKETSYRIIVSGDLGPKEIGKLIKLLQAQQEVLSDDDDGE